MRRGAALLIAMTLTGCGARDCTPSDDRGPADTTVTVTRDGDPVGVTATVTGWSVESHPQTGETTVHIDYRFDRTAEFATRSRVEVYLCAVTEDRRVVGCTSVGDPTDMFPLDADTWIATADAADTAEVLFVSEDVGPAVHPCSDVKDGDDHVPPLSPLPGDVI